MGKVATLPSAYALAQQASAGGELLKLADYESAQAALTLIKPALARVALGVSVKAAAKWLHATGADGMPSVPTLERMIAGYREHGLLALVDQRRGRVRNIYGWELRAQALYARAPRPCYTAVARWLREEGFADAKNHLVCAYLKSLPSRLSETAPKRLGQHYYNQNIRPHVHRHTDGLPVGFIYEGDGHCCDVYVAAPATGNPYRPELTVWLDIRSHKVVGWWLSESESAETTMFSLSHALLSHGHVPAYVHTDPGSGFTARVVSDEQSGFLARFSIQAITALPGNARGKGLTEGWFRWFEEFCGKKFDTFCGHCRTDDALSRLRERIRRGDMKLPSLTEYAQAVAAYIASYNANPQERLGASPDELWQQLERTPLEVPAAAVLRPRKQATVQSWSVRLHNRHYRARDLADFESRQVLVEYSLHDDEHVTVYDLKGRFVCDAELVGKKAWLPASRIEEGQQRRLEGQQKRLQGHLDEAQARARTPIDSAANFLEALEAPAEQAAPRATEPPRSPLELLAPPAPKPARKPRAVSAALQAAIAAEMATPVTEEKPEQRFARWRALDARSQAGEHLSDADLIWMSSYASTGEFRGQLLVWNEFGGGAENTAPEVPHPPCGGSYHLGE